MADRVHPGGSPIEKEAPSQLSGQHSSSEHSKKPSPTPGTYVIQIPKDQIYRVPPPENAHMFKHLSRRKPQQSRLRCCFCSFLAALFILFILAGIAAVVFYLVFRPQSPEYSVVGVSISGFNLKSGSPISPEFDIKIRSQNPNRKVGIHYEKGNAVDVLYNGIRLSNGAWPAFYQPSKNVTVFTTTLKGKTIQLTQKDRKTMLNQQKNREIPFQMKIKAPVRVKIGSVKTWTITVNVNCDVTVDKLTSLSEVVSMKCSHGMDLW